MRFEGLQKVALALNQERSLEVLFRRIANELSRYRGVALARLWIAGPAEQCDFCRAKPNLSNGAPSLHLRASAGGPLEGHDKWVSVEDIFPHDAQRPHQEVRA